MPRILSAECKQEVSTFNPHLSGYDDFCIPRGRELIECHRAVRNEVGGALSAFDVTAGIDLWPAYSAFFITSGGTLAECAWQRIAAEFLESIRAAPPVDGLCSCIHGAMAGEDEAIVKAARDAVGAESRLMVDAGGSDAFWPHGYKWALNTARMLADYGVHWFEEALDPDAVKRYTGGVNLLDRQPRDHHMSITT